MDLVFNCLTLCGELVDVFVNAPQSLFQLVSMGERNAEGVWNVETVTVADEYAFLVKQIVAELFRRYIEIIVDEICRAVRVSVLVEIRILFDPLIDDSFVGIYDLAGALENFIHMLERNSKNPLIEYPTAD